MYAIFVDGDNISPACVSAVDQTLRGKYVCRRIVFARPDNARKWHPSYTVMPSRGRKERQRHFHDA